MNDHVPKLQSAKAMGVTEVNDYITKIQHSLIQTTPKP